MPRALLPLALLPLALLALALLALALPACRPAPEEAAHLDPASLRFSGDEAFALQADYVRRFPRRHSGTEQNRAAAEYLARRLSRSGLRCRLDAWDIVNYSRPVTLQNAVCVLPGERTREILVVAHHDQSPETIEGADNDGSGMAILISLAEIFAAGPPPRHTLVFVSTDAEEYGMLGARRYVQTHPAPRDIIAGLSLDNLGKRWSNGLDLDRVGQFRGYGALWLQLAAREAARAARAAEPDLWLPRLKLPLEQLLEQAVPVSFMDQGPMVAAGIPALGLATTYAEGHDQELWDTYHSPEDLMQYEDPRVLHRSGRAAEAILRELLTRDHFPDESGPYLHFDDRRQVLRGAPLHALFLALVAAFALAAWLPARRRLLPALRAAFPAFLALWLPLFASIVFLYLLVAVGLMDAYHLYPATAKDPALFNPRWPAVILYIAFLAGLLVAARRLVARRAPPLPAPPTPSDRRSLAFAAVTLAAGYILAINPFSLLFFVPLLAWLLLCCREGAARALDLALFFLGGLVVYALLYFFGFVILRNGWAILWYLQMMFSIRMISAPTALAITAVLAAGLSLVVPPPAPRRA